MHGRRPRIGPRGPVAADDLVPAFSWCTGLHPYDVHGRVSDALDSVRPTRVARRGRVAARMDDGVVSLSSRQLQDLSVVVRHVGAAVEDRFGRRRARDFLDRSRCAEKDSSPAHSSGVPG